MLSHTGTIHEPIINHVQTELMGLNRGRELCRSKGEGGFLMRFCASIFYLPGTCALIICSMLGTLQRNPFYNLV